VADKAIKYLIIGNSAGGIGAAEAIREVDAAGTMTIVSDEPYPVYSRPLISNYLADPGPVAKYRYRPTDFYERNNITALLGEKVERLDPKAHTVRLSGGRTLTWEKLLLATGGTPIVPPMEGIGLKGVFTFNKLDEARAIDTFLKSRRGPVRAVVIGGGLIGVSCTEALLRRDVIVTIVEMKDMILNTILDEEASSLEADALTQAGVRIITGHTATAIESRLAGEVSGVTLDDGRAFPAAMVIVAIGVRPRLDALEGSDIEVNRGIVVDSRMATSVPDIYACGDCAEAYDFVIKGKRLTPIWPNAYNGGRVAGLNMAGRDEEYPGGTAMNAMKYFGLHIVSAGFPAAPDESYETLINKDNGNYKKVIIKDGRIAGLVFAGDIEKSGIIYNLMKDGVDVSDFKEALVSADFGLANIPEAAWRDRLPSLPKEAELLPTGAEAPEELPIGD